jgi:hypothetical protein
LKPLATNTHVPLGVVTAYLDETMFRLIDEAAPRFVPHYYKPVEVRELVEFLGTCLSPLERPGGSGADE